MKKAIYLITYPFCYSAGYIVGWIEGFFYVNGGIKNIK